MRTMDASPGWTDSTTQGYKLYDFQRRGIEFCASRGFRALIGDEMGTGKTAQAIGSAEAIKASQILIICPAIARYVWEREIERWSSGGEIQHISSQLDALLPEARWRIITYDLLVAKSETWQIANESDEKAIKALKINALNDQISGSKKYPKKIKIDREYKGKPSFSDVQTTAKWHKIMRRLSGEMIDKLLSFHPALLIVDEAHRVKNKDAKRSGAIDLLSTAIDKVLLLTGTPLRNNEHEAAVLLGYLDAKAKEELGKSKGYTITDIKDYLNYFMLRRTKKEVMPELPEKTRQRIDIDNLDPDDMDRYYCAMNYAEKLHDSAILEGLSESEARQRMLPGIVQARIELALAKVNGGRVSEIIQDVVENKGAAVVFCAHHAVSDTLLSKLSTVGITTALIDGRTSNKHKKKFENEFQGGKIDVIILGILVAESISLHRADTAIFVELDWVPGNMLQAEDRIHRIGQKSNCQIIHLIARDSGDLLDEQMINILDSKLRLINRVLDESQSAIISKIVAGSIQASIIDSILKGKNRKHNDVDNLYGYRKDGTPRLQQPGPGRPALPEQERKRRRSLSKKIYRQVNIEKQRAYHKKWRQSRTTAANSK